MSAPKPSNISAEVLAQYAELVASAPGIERKGATVPYTALNGNMFSYLDKQGRLALRLPPEARAAFLAQYHTPPVAPYGAVQPEYVYVPAELLADTAALAPTFAQSVDYARSLKNKPTTRKAKATSHGSQRRAVAKHERAQAKKKRLAKR